MRKFLPFLLFILSAAAIAGLSYSRSSFEPIAKADENTVLTPETIPPSVAPAATPDQEPVTETNPPAAQSDITTVVFITIDTLRADHLGYMGYSRNTSPFLDNLANKSFVFKNSFTVYPATVPSHAAMFTGLHPIQIGLQNNSRPVEDSNFTLAEQFKKLGFNTGAFVSLISLNNTNFQQGFDTLDFKSSSYAGADFNNNEENRANPVDSRRLAEDTIKEAKTWLDTQNPEDKIFLWVHLYDAHWPYPTDKNIFTDNKSNSSLIKLWTSQGIPLNFYQKPAEANMLNILNRYDGQIKYIDGQIENLYTYFNEKKLNENALWIITSDHGEGLGGHNYFGHHQRVYNEQLRTPLIIHNPKQDIGKIFTAPVENIDIYPTLGDLFGFARENNKLGQSLIPLISTDIPAKETAFSSIQYGFGRETQTDKLETKVKFIPPKGNDNVAEQYALQNENYKYIYYKKIQPDDPPKNEFYDLKKDPREQNNLIDEESEIKNEMFKKILEYIDVISGKISAETMAGNVEDEQDVDPVLEEALRALGY